MGIDSLDLTLRLQQHFGIEIHADETVYLYESPRRIIRLVTARLSGEILPIPDYMPAIKNITTALESLPDYRRLWFRRHLEAHFPRTNREANWRLFADFLDVDLPPLEPAESGVPRLPLECRTHMRLMFWMLDQNSDRIPRLSPHDARPTSPNAADWDREKIQRDVLDILQDVLGLHEDEITLDADMIADLGMD